MRELNYLMDGMKPSTLAELALAINDMIVPGMDADDQHALRTLADAAYDAGIRNCGGDFYSMYFDAVTRKHGDKTMMQIAVYRNGESQEKAEYTDDETHVYQISATEFTVVIGATGQIIDETDSLKVAQRNARLVSMTPEEPEPSEALTVQERNPGFRNW